MKHAASSTEKGFSLYRYSWRFLLTAGLAVALLAVAFLLSYMTPARTFATAQIARFNGFTVSPSQGPAGAIIMVTGTNLRYPDGTLVQLGYTLDFIDCNAAPDSKGGVINNRAFSGWLRWPTSTGTGTFGACALVAGRTLFIGTYHVLSASVPQISVAPTTLNAGKQASVTGANFLPAGTDVNLFWRSVNGGQTLALGTVTSDSTGAFTSTFTVPSRASTGTYSVIATVGSGQPPTLSALKTFHVNGVTIVAVPTPRASPTATAVASPTAQTTATAGSTPAGSSQATHTNDPASLSNGSSMIMPIASGGLLLVVAALVAGILVVRRQRVLTTTPGSGGPSWAGAASLEASGAFSPREVYHPNSFAGPPAHNRSPMPYTAPAPAGAQDVSAIPFDPALAEAMRQAQVSLFATPRPPVQEEVPF